MSLVHFFGGIVVGFLLGIGAAIFYLRWKMQKQLGNLEEQMGAVMDLSDEMSGMMDPENIEDVEEIDPSEVSEGEEKEEKE